MRTMNCYSGVSSRSRFTLPTDEPRSNSLMASAISISRQHASSPCSYDVNASYSIVSSSAIESPSRSPYPVSDDPQALTSASSSAINVAPPSNLQSDAKSETLRLSTLPTEILNSIFDYIVTDRHDIHNSKLLPLGRTCLKLSRDVNRYLYADVCLHSVRQFNKLVWTLLTSSETIAPLVQSFTYTAPGEFTPRAPSGYLPSDLTPILTHLPTILHICPNMESLSLENVNDISLKDWEHLFPESTPSIRRIQKFSWSYYAGWRRGRNFSHVWFPVLARFTSLRQIRLSNCVISPEAMRNVPNDAFVNVDTLYLENICFSLEDMETFAPLLPNVERLDLKTIKVIPSPTTSYHPLPPMFKKLKILTIDCPSRILSANHHICSFLAPSLRTSLQGLSVSGGSSLCPAFFKNLTIDSLAIHLTQLRLCNGFESMRELNDVVVNCIKSNPQTKRVIIEAPSLAVVDKCNVNHGGVSDIGRKGQWVIVDVDYREQKREGRHNIRKFKNKPQSSHSEHGSNRRQQILGIDEQRLLELDSAYRECVRLSSQT
ncbi:hypothetical protein V1525DRAFT_394039 [Lipomyces kononenkoae]|uniref:Uncharacterized protein n=1 Tax=Lipomyces kononenkoae TaxID=34357 RepID=A0ACC3TA45_LIPKO